MHRYVMPLLLALVPAAAAHEPIVETVGAEAEKARGEGLVKANVFRVDRATTLVEAAVRLGFDGRQELGFGVYAAADAEGPYMLVARSTRVVEGRGVDWYASGPLVAPLEAGAHCVVAVSFSGRATYFFEVGESQTTSFGEQVRALAGGRHPLPQMLPGGVDDLAIYHQRLVTRPLTPVDAEPRELSVSAGGRQTLAVEMGAEHAGKPFVVFGTSSGTASSVRVGGIDVPLVPDAYTSALLAWNGTGPLDRVAGRLDQDGRAEVVFALDESTTPSLAGRRLHHVFAVLDVREGRTVLVDVSVAAPLDLVP